MKVKEQLKKTVISVCSTALLIGIGMVGVHAVTVEVGDFTVDRSYSYGSYTTKIKAYNGAGGDIVLPESADFSGISDQKPLGLSDVAQEVHIGIDENGVEAAAFTEILWAGAALPQGRAEMILNRPFLYAVKNKGQILFVGICQDPVP